MPVFRRDISLEYRYRGHIYSQQDRESHCSIYKIL